MAGLTPHGPAERYRGFGNSQPELGDLQELYERQRRLPDIPQTAGSVAARFTLEGTEELDWDYTKRPDQTPGSAASRDIVLGDMACDLATLDEFRHDLWLDRAKSHFRDARDIGVVWLEGSRQLKRDTRGRHQIIAAAAVRHAEMDLWELAAQKKPVKIDYPKLVESYLNIYRYLRWMRPGVEDAVGEALPQLVAVRSGEAVGRHARTREDEQFPLHIVASSQYSEGEHFAKKNPRWDHSLSRSNSYHEFLSPSRRIQVKPVFRNRPGEASTATAYLQAGVLPLSTIRMGWPSPRAVIVSCALDEGIEVEGMLDEVDPKLLMTHDQLDENFGSALDYMLDADIGELLEAASQ